jgi:hypothetical protein
MPKFFLDTEFIESGPAHPIHLLSIGIVGEDDISYYSVVSNPPLELADDWLKENVIRHIDFRQSKPKTEIAKEIVDFVGKDPQFWGYYSDYDWVVLCQLYGRMIDLPESWPMYCLDVKQLAVEHGNPRLPELPDKIEHHALWDAREIKYRYQWLIDNF